MESRQRNFDERFRKWQTYSLSDGGIFFAYSECNSDSRHMGAYADYVRSDQYVTDSVEYTIKKTLLEIMGKTVPLRV